MSNLASLYTDELKRHFKVLYANWIPGTPIELGDYGLLDGNIFIPQGKLKSDFDEFKGDAIQIIEDPTKDTNEFISESGVEVNLASKGSINAGNNTIAKATLEINFSKKDCIYFNATGCTTTRISNKFKIGETLKQLLKSGKWQKEYCVVTDLVQAERTILAISQSSNSGISFEANSPLIENIDLADASIELNLKSQKSLGYKVDAEQGLFILLGLCKIKNPFLWWGGDFKPKSFMMTESTKYKIENAPGIKTEATISELIFGQMGKD